MNTQTILLLISPFLVLFAAMFAYETRQQLILIRGERHEDR